VRSEPARHSALYEGTLVHARLAGTPHRFQRAVYLHYLDLAEVDRLHLGPLLSQRLAAPVWFRSRDYFDGSPTPLATQVRRIVDEALGAAPEGPIRLLTSVRTWGWCFNPLTLAYVFDAPDRRVEAIVASVTNTPWGEREHYVLDARGGLGDLSPVTKRLHVSPFLATEGSYAFTVSEPGENLAVVISLRVEDELVFSASMRLRRAPLTAASTIRLLAAHPLLSHRTSAGIYHEAYRLWRKGVAVVAHPNR
jgi:uncharacterized protein